MISYWKIFRNLSSLLRNLTYLSLLNSFLFLSRFSVSLKSLDNYFFRWFAYKSLFSRFSVLISYNMCSCNHFSISSCFPCFSGSRFFRVRVQGPGPGSGVRVQGPGPGFRSSLSLYEYTFFFINEIFLKKNWNSLWKHIFYYEMQPNFYDVIFAFIMNFHKVTTKITGDRCSVYFMEMFWSL